MWGAIHAIQKERQSRVGALEWWANGNITQWGSEGLTEQGRLDKDLKEVSQAELCGKGIPGRGNSLGKAPRLECI